MTDEETNARLAAATIPLAGQREALVKRMMHATSIKAKIYWLREEAALIGKAIAPLAPCHAGCSHCCNMAVTIDRGEAELIGREIGRKVATPAPARTLRANDILAADDRGEQLRRLDAQGAWMRSNYDGIPCTFLSGGRCSIYEFRPMACRLHWSMEATAQPCELKAGAPTVRYANTQAEQQLYTSVFADNFHLADIRDWFPA